ncbi:DUF4365 domain-containing protein [Priestia filamentosa]|uniref:DUF4365 domain-containing protein n=1 Tax=Priestia filamentosa TaxID=1402861 RepID=UPI003978EE8F
MTKKKSSKKTQRKKGPIDTLIIEHLACLEINHLILQPPFHLVSNIALNDKGISFDGDIEVYKNNEIKKENIIDIVPVQVKGTTVEKTVIRKSKIKHPVDKRDLEVYYKHNRGVLYFVVTINRETYARQAYYQMLTPLELKALINEFNSGKRKGTSMSLYFKKLEKGKLENLCKIFLEEVKKQSKYYIEQSEGMEFTHYKVNFLDVSEDSFDLFEETALIYGVSPDGPDMPLQAAKVAALRTKKTEKVILDNETIDITYEIVNREKSFKIVIENSLTIEVDKKKKSGKFHLGRLKNLNSYLKCLKLTKYYMENSELPLSEVKLKATSLKKGNFKDINIDEAIELHEELLDVCNQIGISGDYEFNNEENLSSLFNTMISIFENKQYDLLNIPKGKELEGAGVLCIELSKYVKVRLIYNDEKFINFYSEDALKTLGGLRPKTNNQGQKIELLDAFPEDWKDYYDKASLYSSPNIEEMVEDANFSFEMFKLSFSDKYHDIRADQTINVSLLYINYYDKSQDKRYLELALELNQRYLAELPKNDIPKVNIYLIKLKQQHKLLEEEQNDILDIQERAENDKNNMVRFACEVLLGNKIKAQRIFNSFDVEEKETMLNYPIYSFYETLN